MPQVCRQASRAEHGHSARPENSMSTKQARIDLLKLSCKSAYLWVRHSVAQKLTHKRSNSPGSVR